MQLVFQVTLRSSLKDRQREANSKLEYRMTAVTDTAPNLWSHCTSTNWREFAPLIPDGFLVIHATDPRWHISTGISRHTQQMSWYVELESHYFVSGSWKRFVNYAIEVGVLFEIFCVETDIYLFSLPILNSLSRSAPL